MSDAIKGEPKQPIINCHTHIFTGNHVPPYLAKTFIPWPLYYLLPVSMVVMSFRFWYNRPYRWQFRSWFKKVNKFLYKIKILVARKWILGILITIIMALTGIQVFFILFDWFTSISTPEDSYKVYVEGVREMLKRYKLLIIPESSNNKFLIVLVFLLIFRRGRNLIWFLSKKIWSFLRILPGPKSTALIIRYLTIGRYAFHNQQQTIFKKLCGQYPPGTSFIILPMDMEFMGAGSLGKDFRYKNQMKELLDLKQNEKYKNLIYPFVFADPRRIAIDPNHFVYHIENDRVILEDCFIKTYIENHKFRGFKIYPALGYYPFDEKLLPLWKYASDNELPILTHCIKGIIYFRGKKNKEWDYHPIFEQSMGGGNYEPLLMKEIKNQDFINNFTHPLNYLGLLEEVLLRKVVGNSKDNKIHQLFGYTNKYTPLKSNLKNLKICFGHFGGDDEWKKFLEMDRYDFANQLIKNPENGIPFFDNGIEAKGKFEQIWKFVDWYSIICSLMLQYPNIYADISYILHNDQIQPLLNQTLLSSKLKEKVLFGTDFYVVRNHKSEKNMLADMVHHLSEDEFDQIARINPREFLKNILHDSM